MLNGERIMIKRSARQIGLLANKDDYYVRFFFVFQRLIEAMIECVCILLV